MVSRGISWGRHSQRSPDGAAKEGGEDVLMRYQVAAEGTVFGHGRWGGGTRAEGRRFEKRRRDANSLLELHTPIKSPRFFSFFSPSLSTSSPTVHHLLPNPVTTLCPSAASTLGRPLRRRSGSRALEMITRRPRR